MTDRFDEDRFDRMLAQTLQRHSEPTPADFTERMITAVKQAEQQRILASVVLQQRLALAASILFGAVTIVAVASSRPLLQRAFTPSLQLLESRWLCGLI